MKVVDRFNVSKPPEGPRKFTFEFSGPGLISVVVVAVLGVVWIFILGVLVGRGHKPEEAVPQVAQIMPSPPSVEQPQSKEPPTVLKPEQLEFQDTLQGRKPPETVTVDSAAKPQAGLTGGGDSGGAAVAQAAPSAQGVTGTSTLEKTPAAVPKGKVATSPAQPDKKAAKTDTAPEKAPAKDASKDQKKDQAKDSKAKKYSATYQVAAFDNKAQAQSEADKYSRKGVSVSIKEVQSGGKTVFRVMAQVKGTETEIKQALEKAGAKSPILRDKKSL